jgi:predicted DNA-binding transcriptional regulator AlpA
MTTARHPLVVLRRDLKRIVGLSSSTVRRLESRGEFPRRRVISAGLIGWALHDIEQWLATRPQVNGPRGLKGE